MTTPQRTVEEIAREIFGAVLHHTVEEELWRIEQALRSVRQSENEACAEIAQKFLPLMNIQDIICESNLKQADVTARAIRNRMKERP